MKVRVAWKNAEKTALVFTFDEELEWDHFHKAFERAHSKMESVSHPVDILLNFQKTQMVPAGALQHLPFIFKDKGNQPTNQNRTVIVGASGLLFVLFGVVRNMHQQGAAKVLDAPSMKQAYDLVRQRADMGKSKRRLH